MVFPKQELSHHCYVQVRGMLQDTDLTEDGKNNLVAISTALKALYDAGKPKAAHRFCSSLLRSLRTHDGVYSALYPDTKAIPMDRDTVIERLQEQVANGGLSMETNEEVGDRFKEAIDYMVSDKSGVIGE